MFWHLFIIFALINLAQRLRCRSDKLNMELTEKKDEIVKYEAVNDKIVRLRGKDIIPDFAVAELYGVQTKEVNQAVRNNPDKFPEGYVFEVDKEELADLQEDVIENDILMYRPCWDYAIEIMDRFE